MKDNNQIEQKLAGSLTAETTQLPPYLPYLLRDFIREAKTKAKEYGVNNLCEFAVQDINESVKTERGYDIAILGAVGDVLGSPAETLDKLKRVVHKNGYILIDEAYLDGEMNDVRYRNYDYLTLSQWKILFQEAGLELIAEITCDDTEAPDDINNNNNCLIRKRAEELAEKYPDKREIFEGYVKSQEKECEDIEDVIVGVTWLLRCL